MKFNIFKFIIFVIWAVSIELFIKAIEKVEEKIARTIIAIPVNIALAGQIAYITLKSKFKKSK